LFAHMEFGALLLSRPSLAKRQGGKCRRQERIFLQQAEQEFLKTPFTKPGQMQFEKGGGTLVRIRAVITSLALRMKAADLESTHSRPPPPRNREDGRLHKIIVVAQVHLQFCSRNRRAGGQASDTALVTEAFDRVIDRPQQQILAAGRNVHERAFESYELTEQLCDGSRHGALGHARKAA